MNSVLIENEPMNVHALEDVNMETFKCLIAGRRRIKFHMPRYAPADEMIELAFSAGFVQYILKSNDNFRYFIHGSEIL
jgi:hypothetical protein